MRKLKSLLAMVMVLVMSLSLAACGSKEEKLEAQIKLGVKYMDKGEYSKAVSAFEKAIDIDEYSITAYEGLVVAMIAEYSEKESDVYESSNTEAGSTTAKPKEETVILSKETGITLTATLPEELPEEIVKVIEKANDVTVSMAGTNGGLDFDNEKRAESLYFTLGQVTIRIPDLYLTYMTSGIDVLGNDIQIAAMLKEGFSNTLKNYVQDGYAEEVGKWADSLDEQFGDDPNFVEEMNSLVGGSVKVADSVWADIDTSTRQELTAWVEEAVALMENSDKNYVLQNGFPEMVESLVDVCEKNGFNNLGEDLEDDISITNGGIGMSYLLSGSVGGAMELVVVKYVAYPGQIGAQVIYVETGSEGEILNQKIMHNYKDVDGTSDSWEGEYTKYTFDYDTLKVLMEGDFLYLEEGFNHYTEEDDFIIGEDNYFLDIDGGYFESSMIEKYMISVFMASGLLGDSPVEDLPVEDFPVVDIPADNSEVPTEVVIDCGHGHGFVDPPTFVNVYCLEHAKEAVPEGNIEKNAEELFRILDDFLCTDREVEDIQNIAELSKQFFSDATYYVKQGELLQEGGKSLAVANNRIEFSKNIGDSRYVIVKIAYQGEYRDYRKVGELIHVYIDDGIDKDLMFHNGEVCYYALGRTDVRVPMESSWYECEYYGKISSGELYLFDIPEEHCLHSHMMSQ